MSTMLGDVKGKETGIGPEEVAVFGTGCFWCSEAVFRELRGVSRVEPGYMGGDPARANYREVCTGTTGHAEVSRISFNPRTITFGELLEVFWATHDPTSLNRQGGDVGPQYRSVIFTSDARQEAEAIRQRRELEESGAVAQPVVTEITTAGTFFPAEPEHKAFFANNPDQGYCRMVIRPKMDKFRRAFKERLRSEVIENG